MRAAVAIAVTATVTIGILAYVMGDAGQDDGPLRATLRIPDLEEPIGHFVGEPIPLVFEVENTGEETLTLVYEQDPPFSFRIDYSEGDVIFQVWSSSFATSRSNFVREWPAGEKMVVRATWDQTEERYGDQVPSGIYRVEASHSGRCEPSDCRVSAYRSVEIQR